MSRITKASLAYSIVFAVGYFVACSSNSASGGGGNSSTLNLRMLNSTVRRTAIFPTNTGRQPVLASLFGMISRAIPLATITNPSALGQSYETVCSAYGSSFGTSIHATFGNSGLISMNFGTAGIGAGNLCTGPPLASVGADENGTPTGFPIFLAGTINSLVAYGTLVSGNRFRCIDTNNTDMLQDTTYVRAYYDLAHDAIVLGSGTTQLSVTCSITLAPGDDVQTIQVQWIKS